MSMPTMISCASTSLISMFTNMTYTTCNTRCVWPLIHHRKSYSGKVVISCTYGEHQAMYPRELQAEHCVIVGSILTHRDIQGKSIMVFLSHLSGYHMTARWKAIITRPEEGKEFLRLYHVETDEKDKKQVTRFLESMYNTNQRNLFPLGYKLHFLFDVKDSIWIHGIKSTNDL
jgi:hypothetical protein